MSDTNEIIKHAKKWIKKEAYTYVFCFEENYDSFLDYLIEETDARSCVKYYFIDKMAHTYPSKRDSVLTEFLFFTDRVICYPSLYKDYFEEIIKTILDIPEFDVYHKDIKILYENFIDISNKRDNDPKFSLLDTTELLIKNTNIKL